MKNREEHKNLFSPGGCLSDYALESLIKGTLSEIEKQTITKHAQTCPLCTDAIGGAEYFNSTAEFRKPLTRMKKSAFRKSLEQEPASRNLFYTSLAIAASITLLIGIFYIYQSGNEIKKSGLLSEKKEISVLPENQANSPLTVEKTETPESETKQVVAGKAKVKKDKTHGHENEINAFAVQVLADTLEVAPTEMQRKEKSADETPEAEDYSGDAATENLSSPEQSRNAGFLDAPKEISEEKAEVSVNRYAAKKEMSQASGSGTVQVSEPEFHNGGLEDFKTYVTDSLKKAFPDLKLETPVRVGFRIEANGKVTKVKLFSGTASEVINTKIINLIKGSPVWVPAFRNGETIAVDRQMELRLNKE